MQKLVMSHVPFTPAQRSAIAELAGQGGYQVVDLDADASGTFLDAQLLVGYFPPDKLGQATQLQWLHTPSAGVEKWAKASLYAHPGVVLTNSSGAFGKSIAEHCIMGILMLRRHARAYEAQQRARGWGRVAPMGFITGSTITVVGLGDIGSRVATYCKAMGATVRGVKARASQKPDYVDELYLTHQLMEAVAGADVVVACLPSAGHTRGIIGGEHLAAMAPGALFLNVGRGDTVDETALIAALQGGQLGGALLDVMTVEPLPQDSPLWTMDNVIITPHVSGGDDDPFNRDQIFAIYTENLRRHLAGQPLQNVVDLQTGY